MRVFAAAGFVALAAISWESLVRESNSAALTRRGIAAFTAKNFEGASTAFRGASEIVTAPETAFNQGTAEIAAGRFASGSAMLEKAAASPALRSAALYNRGNSALAAGAYDHAVRDYVNVLRSSPSDADAKRNLEIALKKRSRQSSQPQQQSPQQQENPGSGGKQKNDGGNDPESILRSVQEQETDELRRMRRARMQTEPVGW